jgi:hypothetical protein
MSSEPLRLPAIPALDHPRGGQIMFRDAGRRPIELSTMRDDPEERLPLGLSILLMLGVSALGWAVLVQAAVALWSVL